MRVERYHALGNDYLVWCGDTALTPITARALCDRHTGVGGDGVLEGWGERPRLCQIWNPDGSVAEKSGNGLRIYARWMVDSGLAVENEPIVLSTGEHQVTAWVRGELVRADMGRASFDPESVPVDPSFPRRLEGPGGPWEVVTVGLGNPHCVVFVDEVDAVPWREWGAALEVHPAFPRRTNVQVAAVAGAGIVDVRIWERGAGPTAASGSSACAVAAAAVSTARMASGPVRVRMPGGEVVVTVQSGFRMLLEGPVERVASVDVDPAWWQRRALMLSSV